ncbi:MAG: DegT/DnrJ/EryC1/StrS family aminotransferase [Deltaproteobacteria bacterium]|nr:DegT/DnrJ/EryC1/StrS family aminotransferase [Deltaproteobacteria bacterium]
MIPVFRPSFDHEELEALREPFATGWVGTGPKVKEFEKQFAALVGVPHAVAVNCCTSALYLALRAAGVEGGEVITPAMTFVATNHAILMAKATPAFADIEPSTLNLDPAEVAKRITPRTRAVVAMHYGGHACHLDELLEITRAQRIPLIEDCAHATGGSYRQRPLGSIGSFGCFSFQAIKNVATGDGGMITLQDAAVAERLHRLAWHGISRDTWARSTGNVYNWEYDVTEVELKYQMNDIAAAVGLVQLRKLARTNGRRRELAARYTAGLADSDALELPREQAYAHSSWHNYVIKVARAAWRDRLVDFLRERGISAGVHYMPTHLYRIYEPYRVSLPVTEEVWQRVVTLPLFPDLAHADQDRVIAAVSDFCRQA